MWWLVVVGAAYVFRGKIAAKLKPLLTANPQQTAYKGNLVTLLAAICYPLPLELVGLGAIKRTAYMLCLWSVVLTSIATIGNNYGMPPLGDGISFSNWKQSMQSMMARTQPWLEKVMQQGPAFHVLFFALIFLAAYPSMPAILILGRRALWTVCTQCAKQNAGGMVWSRFQSTWTKLKAREEEVVLYSTLAEIGIGIWFVVSLLLPSRQIFTTLLYWNYLKTRYQVPGSWQKQHFAAWRMLGSRAEPVLKAVPILNKPLDMAKGWFQPQMR
jgi:hypothetical protein